MVQRLAAALPDLYEADETAWLDAMAALIRRGNHADLDYAHLEEYLSDMARRDRKEVTSRLIVLLSHLLKWTYQPTKRTSSWRATIVTQQQELALDVDKGVLRKHAKSVLGKAHAQAVKRAAAETDLPMETFPEECPYTLEQLLSDDLTGE